MASPTVTVVGSGGGGSLYQGNLPGTAGAGGTGGGAGGSTSCKTNPGVTNSGGGGGGGFCS